MIEIFDDCYEAFCEGMETLIDGAKLAFEWLFIAFVALTLPVWLIPYMFYKALKELNK